jgi:hypothetical protein
LLKLRSLLGALTTEFTATVKPLTVAFSIRLAPVMYEREAFFRTQMTNVAQRSRTIAQIRRDMQEMIERRQRLEAGECNLARMFDVFVKVRTSRAIEEEEEVDKFGFDTELEDLKEYQM